MPAAFPRTLGALRADRRVAPLVAIALGVVILGAWLAWALLAQVAVYRTSTSARIEVSPAPARVASAVDGRVVGAHLEVGAHVAAGDVLVELDATSERIAADKARARVAVLEPEVASIERELAAETDAQRAGSAADLDTEQEARARLRAAQASLAFAEQALARETRLAQTGASTVENREKAETTVAEKRAAFEAIQHELEAMDAAHRERGDTRRAGHEQLARQHDDLANELAAQKAEVERLDHEVERRTIRAPLAGTLGEVAAVRPGAVLHAGDVVATVVPAGTLHVVAAYGATALGRLAPGQPARIRLDGFPWTRYGTLGARVARVGTELRDGAIRVDLDLTEVRASLPVHHGMTCSVDVEVERTSPAALLIRTVGESLDGGQTP